jgi:diguanylate cyclase (GGDEF)-like protein
VKPGTPTSDLIYHRLKLGLKVGEAPDDYVRERMDKPVVQHTAVHEFADGRIIRYTIRPMSNGGGMATHEDVTEREEMSARLKRQYELTREQEEKLRVRNLQFDTAINNMMQGLCFFDADRKLIVCNERYIEMYNLPPGRVGPGTTLSEVFELRSEAGSVPTMPRDEFLKWRSNVALLAEPSDSIIEMRNGRAFLVRHRPMPDGGWVATHEDITEKRQAELKIEHMAHHDSLTGLANRVRLDDRLELALAQAAHGRMVAVHHLDLDRFKAVNDTFGHQAGDRLLKIVASRLREVVRASDTIARMGGDEFVIVQSPISEPSEATLLAERAIAALAEPFEIDGHQSAVGTSVGIAVSPGDGDDSDTLLRNADLALYRAKEDGRGTFRFFEASMDEQMQTRRSMEQDMRKALPAGQFELYYQPVVNLQTSAISGGADPLESSPTRLDLARDLHPACRGKRLHHSARRMGDPAGLPDSRAMAGPSSRSRQHFRVAVPQRGANAGHPRRAGGIRPEADAARDRDHRERAAAGQGVDACDPASIACARDPHRHG